jgi:N-acetyl sugar amidotransferase
MRYCKTCLSPDTRPLSRFNADGICSACEFSSQSHHENYEKRLAELRHLVRKILRGRRQTRWDCIVGVSGGKDSTRQALWVREKLGMTPLLVSVAYPPRQISRNGVDNLSNLVRLGFDVLMLGPAPRLSRRLVREAFLRFCNWCKATEMALFAGVPRIALDRKIPLIFWGENPALQVGDIGTLGDSIWDGNNLVNSNTLAGGDLGWFAEVAGGEKELLFYEFPDRAKLRKHKINTVFLGPAWKDWSAESNSRVALTHGLKFRGGKPEDTGDIQGTNMVDEDWTIVNFLLKFYKLGFSRGTEYANALIRDRIITREEAIEFAEKYDEACAPGYIESFCRYIELSENEFWENVRKFSNPKLFDWSSGRPLKKFKVGEGIIR